MSNLEIRLLGPPRVKSEGESIKVDRRKAIALVAYLAVSGESCPRDVLATLFWPELDQTRARRALRKTLWVLKQGIGEKWLEVERESIALKRGPGLWLDVDRFRALLDECQGHGHSIDQICPDCLAPLAEAVALYRDDFLAGFTLRDSPDFDEWQLLQSENLRNQLIRALEALAHGYSAQREFEKGITHARRWMMLDPLHEPAHRCLMRLYALGEKREAALRQYERCVQALEQELGILPQEETTLLHRQIEQNLELQLTENFSPSPLTCSHNLPLQATCFIGRENELAETKRLLKDPACRLVTLTGAGGIGKTRLALEIAQQMAADKNAPFRHGIYFVPLASLLSAHSLVPTIANSLKLLFHSNASPKEQLLDYLREKRVLLLLDNFEHILEGSELLVDILSSVSGVKLLVTSRERLNLEWEWPLVIKGLDFPDNGDITVIEKYSAIQLFLQAARRTCPGFKLSEDEKRFAISICQLLEGVPLAIKLSASWVETFSCREIAHEIERSLNILATSMQDVPDRHRSMRAAFDHSWSLLSEKEREVFTKLSVFRGGFRREAAERVAGASLTLLSTLMHKSLLVRNPTGQYEMLEVLRQYAEEKLEQTAEEMQSAHERHCKYYFEFLEQQEKHLRGKKQKETLEEIGRAIDNIQAAWEWAIANDDQVAIDRSLNSFSLFYEMRCWFQSGKDLLEKAAKMLRNQDSKSAGSKSNMILGRVLIRQGRFCSLLGCFEEGIEMAQEGLAIARYWKARKEEALALKQMGNTYARLGDYVRARQLTEQALDISRTIGDQQGTARSLIVLGAAAYREGQYAEARQLYEAGLEIYRQIDDLQGIASGLVNLGTVFYSLGERARATQFHEESLAIFRQLGDRWGAWFPLMNIASIAYDLGEYEKARRLSQESLKISQDLGNRWGAANSTYLLGLIAEELGEHDKARTCYEDGLAISREIGNERGTARCLAGLGSMAKEIRSYDKAKKVLQESLDIFLRIHDGEGILGSLNDLADVSCAKEEYRQAKEYYVESLEKAVSMKAISWALTTLIGLATVISQQGEVEVAVEIACYTLNHPVVNFKSRGKAQQLLSRLETQLSSQAFAAARERAKTRNIDHYLEVLHEL